MALRCSLTGHSWGDPRTEVDRDEGLDEVAITEVEYRECERCGEVDVITENTEVTMMAGDDGADGAADEVDEAAEGATDDGDVGPRHVETDDDAVIIDAGMERADAGSSPDAADDGQDPGDGEDVGGDYVGIAADGAGTTATRIDAGSYRCPECGFDEDAAASSHRPGDLCPRCRNGYLEEQD